MKAYRRLVTGLWLLVMGMGFLWFGFFGIVDLKPQMALSDSEVQQRAREMGWVPLKEALAPQTTAAESTAAESTQDEDPD